MKPSADAPRSVKRCERELFYESLGLPPRNCITDDRTLCPVCLEKEIVRYDRAEKGRKKP